MKIGDVSGSNLSYSTGTITTNDHISESLLIRKQESNDASSYSLIFEIDQPKAINGIHFSIDLKGVELLGIESDLKNFNSDNYNLTDDGILHISWVDARNNYNASSHLFTLNFKENIRNKYINEIIKSEVYFENETINIEHHNDFAENVVRSISDLMVYPNPINVETIVSFNNKTDGNVTMAIYDVEGKFIYNDVYRSSEGNNKIQIPQSILHRSSGVFIIRLTSQQNSLLERIVLTK